jgi:hypothetical protein
MTWIGINPASEPFESVALVAAILYIDPEEVTPTEMADFYNDFLDPTVCQLTLPPKSKPITHYPNPVER